MKENQRIILIIGVSFALLELLCPPTYLGRLFFGISPVPNTNPNIDFTNLLMHLAVISVATLLLYLVCASTTLGRLWAGIWYDPSNPS